MSTKNIQCKKRKIVVWIISIGIIAALFFGISKFISYRTMPPFAAEREEHTRLCYQRPYLAFL